MGLLCKKLRFETYPPVGTNFVGWYVPRLQRKENRTYIRGQLQEKIRPVAQHLEQPVWFFPATGLWRLWYSVSQSSLEK